MSFDIGSMIVLGFETLTVSTTAVTITATLVQPTSGNVQNAKIAKIANRSVGSGIVHYRVDGTAPTASVGDELLPGDILILETHDEVANFRAIARTNEPDATLNVTTYH